MKKLMTICLVALILPASVLATTVAIGDTFITNSWGQQWNESGVGNFDLIAAQYVSGSTFETPGLRNPSDGSWISGTNGSISYLSGLSLASLNFDTIFNDPQVTPTVFDFVAFNGTTIVDSARITNDSSSGGQSVGYGWYALSAVWAPDRLAVPEPATMAILCLGSVMGLLGRKTRKA